MGWKYKRAAQIDMDLAQHVATEHKNEAAIAKEARKAKEEQSHRRPQPKAKAKGEGAKDAHTRRETGHLGPAWRDYFLVAVEFLTTTVLGSFSF